MFYTYHATPIINLDSIMQHGILPSMSQGKKPLVWIHSMSKREWAILHTMTRHNIGIEKVSILQLRIPRSWYKKTAWKGIYTVNRRIPQNRIDYIESTDEIMHQFGFVGYTHQIGHSVW